ncbi:MAG: cysteine peptidase family C39 domain-containing protein [Candidatus Nanoarchaeia archaeon]|jgi:hypothetical protein
MAVDYNAELQKEKENFSDNATELNSFLDQLTGLETKFNEFNVKIQGLDNSYEKGEAVTDLEARIKDFNDKLSKLPATSGQLYANLIGTINEIKTGIEESYNNSMAEYDSKVAVLKNNIVTLTDYINTIDKILIQNGLLSKESADEIIIDGLKGKEWSGVGACGLTCTRMILDYLGIKIPLTNEEIIDDGKADYLAKYKTKPNDSFDEEFSLANKLYEINKTTNKKVCDSLLDYTYEWKDTFDLINLLNDITGIKINENESDDKKFFARKMDLDELKMYMKAVKDDKALPPIMYLNENHFVMVKGVKNDKVIYLDPNSGKEKEKQYNLLQNKNKALVLPLYKP